MGYYEAFGNAENSWFQTWISMPVLLNIGGSTVLADPSEWARLTENGEPIALLDGEPVFLSADDEGRPLGPIGNNKCAGWMTLNGGVSVEAVLEWMAAQSKRNIRASKNGLRMLQNFATHGHPNPFKEDKPIRRFTRRGKLLPVSAPQQ